MGRRGNLFTLAPRTFRKYRHTDDTGHVETVAAGGFPLPTWPDGRWCFEVYLYLTSGKGKLSLASRGGSYGTIAYALSHLIRYCFFNRLGFLELTDSHFTMFVQGLSAKSERVPGRHSALRSTNRVLQIGRESLSFLHFIGVYYGLPNFINSEGAIRSTRKEFTLPSTRAGSRKIVRNYWEHESFPPRSPIKRRHAIGDEYVSRLRRAVVLLGRSPFLRQRRFLLIRLLDATGARRIEIVNLSIASVIEAQQTAERDGSSYLRLLTFKKPGGPQERFVPIDEVTLTALSDFIEVFRAPVVAKVGFDCGFVLLSDRGSKLEPNTLTQELSQLRKAAGITGKAHPHLFRHRYVSRRLVQLISDRDLGDTASVIAYLLKTGAAMQRLLEETGHASLKSLEPYIDDIMMSKNGRLETLETADLVRLSASVQISVDELTLLRGTLSPEILLELTLSSYKAYASALKRQV